VNRSGSTAEDAPAVLVVDDEPSIRTLIAAALHAQGYRVFQAADGVQAIDIAVTYRPDLILLDVALPLLSGHEVCRRLRRSPATASTPVLLLSGIASAAGTELARSLGAQGVIAKPFALAGLVRRVASELRRPALAVPAKHT
jgi:DNA-binding response OmpR family regulator